MALIFDNGLILKTGQCHLTTLLLKPHRMNQNENIQKHHGNWALGGLPHLDSEDDIWLQWYVLVLIYCWHIVLPNIFTGLQRGVKIFLNHVPLALAKYQRKFLTLCKSEGSCEFALVLSQFWESTHPKRVKRIDCRVLDKLLPVRI